MLHPAPALTISAEAAFSSNKEAVSSILIGSIRYCPDCLTGLDSYKTNRIYM
jgi:hypothetical protein